MKARRVMAVVIALSVFIWVRARDRASSDPEEAPRSTERYRPTVQEGLGASVAILLDNSGSMSDSPEGGGNPKADIARDVLSQVLAQTDSFTSRQPGFPVNIGLYVFSTFVTRAMPMGPYDRERLRSTLATLPSPDGGTAIGDAMEAAVTDLYGAGTIRKY